MSLADHPSAQTHFALIGGRVLVKACRSLAIVVTIDPTKVTCPTCQEALRRLERFLVMLEDTDAD